MCFVCVSLHLSTSRLELGHRHCLCVCCPPLLCCRFATCLLLVMLSVLYPHFLFVFQVIIALDIVSHWMQMYRSVPIPWRGGKGLLDADVYRFAHIPWGGGRGHWMQMYRSAPIPWGWGRGHWMQMYIGLLPSHGDGGGVTGCRCIGLLPSHGEGGEVG